MLLKYLWPSSSSEDVHPLHAVHTGRDESDAISIENVSRQECSNCRTQLCGKPAFHCKLCSFFLCSDCNTGYDHPVHVQHKLYKTFSLSWRCNLCYRNYSDNSCQYRCTVCDFNVCGDCFAPKLHPLHNHELKRRDVRHVYHTGHGDWFCDICRNNNGPGMAYPWNCKDCQFDLCDNCVKPWTSTHHPEHPLLKSDSRVLYQSFNGGWKCDRCYDSFNPNLNHVPYHCKQCDFDLCENCMRQTADISSKVGFDVPAPMRQSFLAEGTENRSAASTVTQNGLLIASPEEDMREFNPNDTERCVVCCNRAKNATIVHGTTGHVCCCLECAAVLYRDNSPCPICRARIDRVIKQYTV